MTVQEGTKPQQERARRSRALILDRAAEAFAEHGYEGVSLNRIIGATGLTKGAFYFHFRSKEELALAVFRAKQAELLDGLREDIQRAKTALEALAILFRSRARRLEREPSLGCFLRLASDLGVRYGPGSEFAESYEAPLAFLVDLVKRGQKEGVIRAPLRPRAAAETLFSAMLGCDELSRVISGNKDLARRTERWLSVLLEALAVPDAGIGA